MPEVEVVLRMLVEESVFETELTVAEVLKLWGWVRFQLSSFEMAESVGDSEVLEVVL